MVPWVLLACALATFAVVGLVLLDRQRRFLLSDPQRRWLLVRYGRERDVTAPIFVRPSMPLPAPLVIAANQRNAVAAEVRESSEPHEPSHEPSTDALVYVDLEGRCTFSNAAGRELLGSRGGRPALRDVLAGGSNETAALLQSLAQQGQVTQHTSVLAGAIAEPLEINGVALRDRDDNFWGAALFIRRTHESESR